MNEVVLPKHVKDLTGKRFGRLVAVEFVSGGDHATWKFKCDCGNDVVLKAKDVTRKNGTVSCGCYRRDRAGKLNLIHGGSFDRLYTVWHSIQIRCYDENDKGYKNYGGRGIKMCDAWAKDYAEFRDWAYANGYDENADPHFCTIDRIDNNADYGPDNCRWVTPKEQSINRRTNVFVEHDGKRKTISEWSSEMGISSSTISKRIRKGWDPEDAILTKPNRGIKYDYGK